MDELATLCVVEIINFDLLLANRRLGHGCQRKELLANAYMEIEFCFQFQSTTVRLHKKKKNK